LAAVQEGEINLKVRAKKAQLNEQVMEVYSTQDEVERAWLVWPIKAIVESGYIFFLNMCRIIMKKRYLTNNQCYHILYKLYDHKPLTKIKLKMTFLLIVEKHWMGIGSEENLSNFEDGIQKQGIFQ